MREVLNIPGVIGVDKVNPKLEMLREILRDTQPPVVVFCWHRNYASFLARELKASVVTGATPMGSRAEIVRQFQAGKIPVLVANIAAAGVGIDLHTASTAIFAENALPGHLCTQAEDRLHRLGQRSVTTIYRLSAPGTVEAGGWSAVTRYHSDAELALATQHVIDRILGRS